MLIIWKGLESGKMINRREFLLWLGMSGLTLTQGLEYLEQNSQKDIEEKIYNMPKDIHIANYTADSVEGKRKQGGVGFFVNDYYITTAHICQSLEQIKTKTPFGMMDIEIDITNKEMKIGEVPFEIMYENFHTDVLIAKSKGRVYKNLPAIPNRSDVKYGDKIYIVGNPALQGTNIRHGYVSDLDGMTDKLGDREHVFGVDFSLFGGDSGSPVLNDKGELIGLGRYDAANRFGYINKIGLYLDEIERLKGVVTKPIHERKSRRN